MRLTLIALATLLMAFLIFICSIYVESQRVTLSHARSAYENAAATTHFKLEQAVLNIVSDAGLVSNLKDNLSNSLKLALFSKLREGELDELQVVNGKCQVISKAGFDKLAVPTDCSKEGFYWTQSTDKIPLLAFAKKFALDTQTSFTLLGFAALSDPWLKNNTSLTNLLSSLGVHVGTSRAAQVLLPFGESSTDGFVASLTTDRMALRVLGNLVTAEQPYLFLLTLFLFFAGLIVLTISLGTQKALAFAARRRGETFIQWCRNIPGSLAPADMQQAGGRVGSELSIAQKLVADACMKLTNDREEAEKKIRMLEQNIGELRAEMQEKDKALCNVAEADSLVIQVHRSAPYLLRRFERIAEGLDTFKFVVRDQLIPNITRLMPIMETWRAGIEAWGSRRYLRTLYEKPGTTAETLLEEHLATISQSAHNSLTCAAALAEQIPAIGERIHSFAGVIASWYGMALAPNDDSSFSRNADIFGQAEGLFRCDVRSKYIRISRNTTAAEAPLGVPPHIMSAAIYHTYLALASVSPTEEKQSSLPLILIVQNKIAEPKRFLTFTLTDGKALLKTDRTPEFTTQLRIATLLLAPFAVETTLMPTVDGASPIAFAWVPPGFSKQSNIDPQGKSPSTSAVSLNI